MNTFNTLCINGARFFGVTTATLYSTQDLLHTPETSRLPRASLAAFAACLAAPYLVQGAIAAGKKITPVLQDAYTWCKENKKTLTMAITTTAFSAIGYYLYTKKNFENSVLTADPKLSKNNTQEVKTTANASTAHTTVDTQENQPTIDASTAHTDADTQADQTTTKPPTPADNH